MEKTFITAALVGSTSTKSDNAAIPITPDEIVKSAVEAHQAGASIVHIHARDPKTELHSNQFILFKEIYDRVRSHCDVLLNLTTSYGATLIIDKDGSINTRSSNLLSPEVRVSHVLKLKPDLCSLDIATMNFGQRIFTNYDPVVEEMATLIRESSTKPEIELFDLGHIEMAKRLINKGLIKGVPHFQLCMGTSGGMAAIPVNACQAVTLLPKPCTWSMFGIGKNQFPMVAMSVLLGGHVRVGLEDNLYLKKGVKAKSSAELVSKAVSIIGNLDGEVASVEETRKILNLR